MSILPVNFAFLLFEEIGIIPFSFARRAGENYISTIAANRIFLWYFLNLWRMLDAFRRYLSVTRLKLTHVLILCRNCVHCVRMCSEKCMQSTPICVVKLFPLFACTVILLHGFITEKTV